MAIARALVSKPTVLFADEPTGNLDSATSGEILELLRRSVDEYGQTIVMVTHEARAAAIAHRVLFLADGEIVRELGECDSHDDPHGHGRGRRRVTRFALKGLLSRKLRTALTAIAIVLGVAMISGTYVLTDSIDQAFGKIFTDIRQGSDAVISGKSAFDTSESDAALTPDIRRDAPPEGAGSSPRSGRQREA